MNHPAYALHARIGKLGVDALLFNHSETAPSSTVRWVSGFSGSDGAVTLTRTERHLFTDGRYKTQAALESPGFRIHIERGKLEALGKHFAEAGVKRVGIEPGRVSWQFVRDLEKRADVEPIPLSSEFSENLRIRKTPEERDKIRRAARIASSSC
jgi:Xaa-Pro aminopeptidase